MSFLTTSRFLDSTNLVEDDSTPSKNRQRRRSRQTSPPNHSSSSSDEIAPINLPQQQPQQPEEAQVEVEDQWANDPAMSLLSRSAPALSSPSPLTRKLKASTAMGTATGIAPYHHHHHLLSTTFGIGASTAVVKEDDSWEMPLPSPAATAGGVKLTWQQEESLKASNNTSSRQSSQHVRSRTDSASASTRRNQRGNGSGGNNNNGRPVLNGSLSDTPSSTKVSNGGLTWQQTLLQSPSSTLLSSPLLYPNSTTTPQKQKKNQQRDYETFGFNSLSLDSPSLTLSEDVFAPTPSSASSSPTKFGGNVLAAGTRYAGPTFHNSPLAKELPMPSFMKRRLLLSATA